MNSVSIAKRLTSRGLVCAASNVSGVPCGARSMSVISDAFLSEIPKTDLHVHLDGSLRVPTIIDLAQQEGVELPAYTEEELLQNTFKEDYGSLVEYLECFQYTTAVMNSEDNLRRVAYEFACDNYSEGVRYFEARFAPQLHAGRSPDLTVPRVLHAVNEGFARACDEFNAGRVDAATPPFTYGIIACALRFFVPEMSPYYASLFDVMGAVPVEDVYAASSKALVADAVHVRDVDRLPIVALDIAGAEAGFPGKPHKPAFDEAHRKFLGRTVHAGEAFGPESVKQAMIDLNCQRVGHGHHTFLVDSMGDDARAKIADPEKYVNNLIDYAGRNRITMEVCLTSNEQTMPWLQDGNLGKHTFRTMVDTGISASICTDNRLMSRTTTSRELRRAVDTFDLSPAELKRVVLTGFDTAFFPGSFSEHQQYVEQVKTMYESLEAKHGVVA